MLFLSNKTKCRIVIVIKQSIGSSNQTFSKKETQVTCTQEVFKELLNQLHS